MIDQPEGLFVYGTLLPGHCNHQRIADHIRSARPGMIQGILFDLGAFPALIHGEGRVRGTMLDVDAEALRITDFIEGCHPDGGHSLYIREMVEVEVDLDHSNIVDAWTYFFANPDHIQDRPRLRDGDDDGVAVYSWPAE